MLVGLRRSLASDTPDGRNRVERSVVRQHGTLHAADDRRRRVGANRDEHRHGPSVPRHDVLRPRLLDVIDELEAPRLELRRAHLGLRRLGPLGRRAGNRHGHNFMPISSLCPSVCQWRVFVAVPTRSDPPVFRLAGSIPSTPPSRWRACPRATTSSSSQSPPKARQCSTRAWPSPCGDSARATAPRGAFPSQ